MSDPQPSRSPFLEYFIRETGQIVRGRGIAWRRSVFLAVSFAVALFMWATISQRSSIQFGRDGFMALMLVNGYFLFTLTSSFFSKAITSEREEGTLDLLRITGLAPGALIAGKGLSLYFRVVLLLLAQVPLCALCVVLGGVSPGQIGAAYLLFASLLFFVCQGALFWSVVSKTSRAAFHNTVGVCICLYIFPRLILLSQTVFPGVVRGPVVDAVTWFTSLNPYRSFHEMMSGGGWPVASILFHFAAGAGFLVLAASMFERTCLREQLRMITVATPKAVKRRGVVPRAGRFPLAWKEYYFMAGGRRGTRIRWLAYGAAACALALLVSRGKHWTTTDATFCGSGFMLIGAFGLVSEIAFASTKLLGAEVLARTLGDIVALPVSTRRILCEKALGHLPSALPAFSILALGVLLVRPDKRAWLDVDSHWEWWAMVSYILMQCALLILATIRWSLRLPSSVFAVTFSLLMYGNFFVFGMLSELAEMPATAVALAMAGLTVVFGYRICKSFPEAMARVAAK